MISDFGKTKPIKPNKTDSPKSQDSFYNKLKAGEDEIKAENYNAFLDSITQDPNIRIFQKKELVVYDIIDSLDLFNDLHVEVYKAYFEFNGQKCSVFKIHITKLESLNFFRKRIFFLKIFHPYMLNYYGIMPEFDLIESKFH